MIDQDFIMLIMNCKKYQKKALFQKQTWLPLVPYYIKYYHVVGDELLDNEYKFDDAMQEFLVFYISLFSSLFSFLLVSIDL